MQFSVNGVDPNVLVYAGITGIFFGILFLLVLLYRRIRILFRKFSKQKAPSIRLLGSLRNLILILLWTSIFGMLLFLGFFMRSYHAFTHEEPVAEIIIKQMAGKQKSHVTLIQFLSPDSQMVHHFTIKGDQWMLEGDILKWEDWLNFLGLHTRYRLTRIRGRYLRTTDEIRESPTIYSLTQDEEHPFWRYLYRYGYQLPFVSTVYGNAAFQSSKENRRFVVYVSTSGFVVREKQD